MDKVIGRANQNNCQINLQRFHEGDQPFSSVCCHLKELTVGFSLNVSHKFAEFSDKKIRNQLNLNSVSSVCQTEMIPQYNRGTGNRADLKIESNSCFTDFLDSLKLLNSMKVLFHLFKP